MKKEMNFIGLDTEYPTADGGRITRLHFDGAASPLASEIAIKSIERLLPHYSNSHSYVHASAQISTRAFRWAHDTVLATLGANKEEYTAIFIGSGTTAAINRLARGLSKNRASKSVALVSSMEHHANDLPHRNAVDKVIHIPLTGYDQAMGGVDLKAFEELCKQHADALNYVAVSSISNVTGIQNSLKDITRIAHQYGALVLVDGAQSVAHTTTCISEYDIDFFVFSGHKIYTPMSPGVMVAKKSILAKLSGQDVGGGSVASVSLYDYELLTQYPEKEQSGTPNIVGAVALASVLEALHKIGFKKIEQHARHLMNSLLNGLQKIEGITVYGDLNESRLGAIAFNHNDIDHGLLAAILSDYFAIAVRNECFCAHPYVSALLKETLWALELDDIPETEYDAYINRKRGMVRASLSLYNTASDVGKLLTSLKQIINNIEDYRRHYTVMPDGTYRHNTFKLDWQLEMQLK